jgi:hypothetical protein
MRDVWVMVVLAAMAGAALGAATAPAGTYREEFKKSQSYAGPRTEETLGRLRGELEKPETRMRALRELIDFAGPKLYQTGSMMMVFQDGTTEIRGEAAAMVVAASDDATIRAGLVGKDPVVEYWSIWNFQRLKDARGMLPVLEKLASGEDESIRSRAVEMLGRYPEEKGFLAQRARTEKSPYVLEETLLRNSAGEVPREFGKRMAALMADPDLEVRKKALSFVAGNWISAPSRQMFVDAPLMDVLLGRAAAREEDSAAALALFAQEANQPAFANARAAATWWSGHREDWALARIPRSVQQNGLQVIPSITTRGTIGGTPAWEATVTLTNKTRSAMVFNTAWLAHSDWELFGADGKRITFDQAKKGPAVWVNLGPGDRASTPVAIALPELAAGRYTLRGVLDMIADAEDQKAAPAGEQVLNGQLVLPAIEVEVSGR